MLYKKDYESPVCKILLLAEDEYLIGCHFEGSKYYPTTLEKSACTGKSHVIEETCEYLDHYFKGQIPTKCPHIKLEGTAFQKDVWNLLLEIPYGEVRTYGDLAKIMAKKRGIQKMSSQAIGQAVGKNPIGIIVPCHRVIGQNGSLIGYAGGLDKKKILLELEMHGKIDR